MRYSPEILYAYELGARVPAKTVPLVAVSTFLKAVDDILTGRRPCFVPSRADGDDNDLGPMKSAHDVVEKRPDAVLAPAYLNSGEAGFLDLDHILSGLLPESKMMSDSIEQIIEGIKNYTTQVTRQEKMGTCRPRWGLGRFSISSSKLRRERVPLPRRRFWIRLRF